MKDVFCSVYSVEAPPEKAIVDIAEVGGVGVICASI